MPRAARRTRGRPPHPDVLTPAEWRVVNWVRHGVTNRTISKRLRISLDGVKFHVANAVAKLGVANRAALRKWKGAPMNSPLNKRTDTEAGTAPALGPIGQISRQVKDLALAIEFYGTTMGLPHLFTFGDLAFFDCGGVRLYLTSHKAEKGSDGDSVIYFRTPDIDASHKQLVERGVVFKGAPHMIHRHANGMEEWMAFFEDPDGQLLALMSQVTPRWSN
jgi:DNA-binding CsgD family transcriptional regulator/predicted enzyme related to lactoylglutathione lyase